MRPISFLRMARWARRPPSWERVMLYAAVIAVCIIIALGEFWFGWPDWATVERKPVSMPKLQPLKP